MQPIQFKYPLSDRAGRAPWLALYVKSRHEKVISTALSGKGYELFLPLYTRTYKSGKKAELPIFPGYVFCRSEKNAILPLVETPGVFSVVSSGIEPLHVPEEDISRVRTLVTSGLSAEPFPYFFAGQKVVVISGPLQGLSGTIREVGTQRWLIISVELLRRSVAVKIDRDAICVPGDRAIAVGATA